MSRLYLRIYLAVIGSLFVFALLAGLAAGLTRAFDDGEGPGWSDIVAEIAERLLPSSRDAKGLASQLAFWNERTGYALMLLSPDGSVIASAGAFPAGFTGEDAGEARGGHVWRGAGGMRGLTLKDGRRLIVAHPQRAYVWGRHWRWPAALLGIGLAVAIAAYPLIRYLTRRLERLEAGVAAFGGGDLSARAVITGRDEIARLGVTFNAAADRIEELLNAHKALLANASHELRSPLSRLRMAVEGLSRGTEEGAVKSEIVKNIEELDALVDEILLASRLQADAAHTLRQEQVDLIGVLAEECAHFDASLIVEGSAVPDLTGDARLLTRLFRNLLENAARYCPDKPPVVKICGGDGFVTVSVCDRGPGIPEGERETIFEPFYRLKNRPESAGGVGLGLALVRQIAARHGGSVLCLPRPGGGTCMEVLLPAAGAD